MKKIISCIIMLALFSIQSFAKIGVVVNKNLYPFIQTSINGYVFDLQKIDKKTVWLDGTTFDETNSIKQFKDSLIRHYNYDNLEGVVFVGDLPIAEYEINGEEYSHFPCDLYFMDLNGNWLDNALNGAWNGYAKTGVFDGHSGNIKAEIWLSRITAGSIPSLGTERDIVTAYFYKVHRRMIGEDPSISRYLICANDTQWPNAVQDACASILGYSPDLVDVFLRTKNEDTYENWENGLVRGYESAIIFEHSSPNDNGLIGGYDYKDYIYDTTTNTRFYNLYACSNSNFSVPDNMGTLYALGHNGLISVGSTKDGAMCGFDKYYGPMANDSSFGECFKSWFNNYVLADDVTDRSGMISWHYGMTLCGAGTLHLYQKKFPAPKVVVYQNNYSPTKLAVQAEFKIVNRSDEAINLSDLNLFYYTFDPSLPVSSMDWNLLSCSQGSVTANFEKLLNPVQSGEKKADTKIALSFTGGLLQAHDSLTFLGYFNDKTWNYEFDESDDWSHLTANNKLGENVVLFSKSQNKAIFGNSPEPDPSDFQLSSSPDPVENNATISFVYNGTALLGQTATIGLYNDGSLRQNFTTKILSGKNEVEVDFGSYTDGVYMVNLSINGNIVDTTFINHHYVGGGWLKVLPDPTNFKDVEIGHTHSRVFLIKNDGDRVIHITDVKIDNPLFGLDEQLPITLEGNFSKLIMFNFTPEGYSTETANISLISDAPYTPVVKSSLIGNGIYDYKFAVTPDPLNTDAVISFNIDNPSLNNTIANFGLSRVLADNSIQEIENFSATIKNGINTVSRPTWDNLSPGNYRLVMSFAGWMVSAAECLFIKDPTHYAVTVSPSPLRTGSTISFSMNNPANVGKTAQFSLYQIFQNGAPRVLVQQFTNKVSSGTNSITKPDWDYLPPGYYTLEMSVNGTLPSSYPFEKLSNPNVFHLTVTPSPVIDNAKVTYTVSDANLAGKMVSLTCKQNGTVKFTQTQTAVGGTNTLNIPFNDYNQLVAGQYTLVLSVYSFKVDSALFTKVDKNTTISVSPSSVNFGQVTINSQKTASITLTNIGNSNAIVSGLTLKKSVYTQNGVVPITLAPGTSKTITLTFKPTAAGTVPDTLVIINAPDSKIQTLIVPLSGQGVNQTSNLQVTMTPDGSTTNNTIAPSMVLKNNGSQSINVSDLVIEYYTYDSSVNVSNLRSDIYYCTAGGPNASISRLPTVMGNSTQKADVVVKFLFTSGTLGANQSISLNFGLHTADWRYNFKEADDWSRVIGTSNSAPNVVVRSKSSGQVLYGTAPGTL